MMDNSISIKQFPKSSILFDKEIGSGSFGKVYKASIRDSKYPTVAVKIFLEQIRNLASAKQRAQKKKAYGELNKVAMLEHENVVKLIGMVDEEMPWLIFEYMKDGNLLEYVVRKRDSLKEKSLIRFARDISNGMTYLHLNHILHKDLAARNILLDGKRAKIADLGLSSILHEEDDGSYALGGKVFPYRHAAVECVIEEIFTFESDVWAFGVLMWEMWTGGRTPYGKENKQPEVRRFVVEGHNPTDFIKPNCHPHIASIFKSIFQLKRANRPMFDDLTPVFDSLLHGGKVQMPVLRSREPSPNRHPDLQASADENAMDPSRYRSYSNDRRILEHSRYRSKSNEKLLDRHSHHFGSSEKLLDQPPHVRASNEKLLDQASHVRASNEKLLDQPPNVRGSNEKLRDVTLGTVSKRSQVKQRSSDFPSQYKNSLTVRGVSPLSISTPNLNNPGTASVRILSSSRPQVYRRQEIETSPQGSPPGLLTIQFTPPMKSYIESRRFSGDIISEVPNGTFGRTTSFTNVSNRLQSSNRSGSAAVLSHRNGHEPQPYLDTNTDSRDYRPTMSNGYIPNRFGPRK